MDYDKWNTAQTCWTTQAIYFPNLSLLSYYPTLYLHRVVHQVRCQYCLQYCQSEKPRYFWCTPLLLAKVDQIKALESSGFGHTYLLSISLLNSMGLLKGDILNWISLLYHCLQRFDLKGVLFVTTLWSKFHSLMYLLKRIFPKK